MNIDCYRHSLSGPDKQDDIVLWSAADALVMKWVALEIKDLLPLQSRCVHTAGHRGGRDSLAEITQKLAQGARFVWRTVLPAYPETAALASRLSFYPFAGAAEHY